MATPVLSWLDDFFGPAIVRLVDTFFPKRPVLWFVGDGVSVADDATNKATVVTIGAAEGDAGLPGGSNKAVQYKIDATTFGGDSYWSFQSTGRLHAQSSGFITYGGIGDTFHGSAFLRLPALTSHVVIGSRDSGNTMDVAMLSRIGDTTLVGEFGVGNAYLQGSGAFVWGTDGVQLLGGPTSFDGLVLRGTAAACRIAKPIGGDQIRSIPFRWMSITITQSSTADTTLTDAQAENVMLKISGTPGGDFAVIAPNLIGAMFHVKNGTANNCTVKRSGGTGVVLAAGALKTVMHTGSDYEVVG